jgi:hypothetical protein
MGSEALLNTPRTLQVSMIIKTIERHMEASMMPNRGLTVTSSTMPKL